MNYNAIEKCITITVEIIISYSYDVKEVMCGFNINCVHLPKNHYYYCVLNDNNINFVYNTHLRSSAIKSNIIVNR